MWFLKSCSRVLCGLGMGKCLKDVLGVPKVARDNSWWRKQTGANLSHLTRSLEWALAGIGWHLLFFWPLPHGCKIVAGAPSIMSTIKTEKSRDEMTPSSSTKFCIRQSKTFPKNHPSSFYISWPEICHMATSSSRRA